MYVPVPGFEPTSSVFLGECVTHWAIVVDIHKYHHKEKCGVTIK